MSISVGQRIALTLIVILSLFLLTSVASYHSFNSVGEQVDIAVNKASPRVAVSGDLRANLLETKYILLEYLSGKGSQVGEDVSLSLQRIEQTFAAAFQQLQTIEGNNSSQALTDAQETTENIFAKSNQIVQQKQLYWTQQQQIQEQAEEYKYLTSEIVYTLEDLLFEEFRYDYLKVLKPLRDDLSFLASKVTNLLKTTDVSKADKQYQDIQATIARIEKGVSEAKSLDEEAYESIIETWQPYKAQLLDDKLTLVSHLNGIRATEKSNVLLVEIEALVTRNEGLIDQFIQLAKQQEGEVKISTSDTIQQGKLLIIVGAALAVICSLLFGIRLIRYLQSALRQVVSGIARIAQGDLTTALPVKGNDELTELSVSTNQLSEQLRNLVNQIKTTVDQVHNTAKISSDISQETLQGVEQQGVQSARLSATATEMEASSNEVADHARQTLDDAIQAADILQNSSSALQSNNQAIRQLSEQVSSSMHEVNQLKKHSDSISEVIDVIRAIAEQTNLLALNAAIEAARAGETGRGFAVVADEVRSLATRTQGSITDIEQMVSNLQTGAEKSAKTLSACSSEAVNCSDQLSASTQDLNQVLEAVQRMREMNSQVATATDEQRSTVVDISQSLTEISTIMVQTTQGAETAAQQSQSLLSMSDNLSQQVLRFKV